MRFRKLKQNMQRASQLEKKEKMRHFYAPYSMKIKALIIDLFMIYAPILYIFTYAVLGGKDAFQNSQVAPLIAVGIYGIIYAIFLAYSGQTPGKKAYDLKVLDAISGTKISFLRAVFRFIAFLISATTLFGILLPLFRRDKKALHDLLSRTVEVKEKL
ncbi:MAG: RDD family protein [Campylobacterales bacterium]|nr:RDD family protein [Campylobacterales bacterium]